MLLVYFYRISILSVAMVCVQKHAFRNLVQQDQSRFSSNGHSTDYNVIPMGNLSSHTQNS